MSKDLSEQEQRRAEAINLHEIEGNPFTPEDEALFQMFDREGYTPEQRIRYIQKELTKSPKIAIIGI